MDGSLQIQVLIEGVYLSSSHPYLINSEVLPLNNPKQWERILDGLTKVLLQYKEALKVEPIQRFELLYQSIDNTIGALLSLHGREIRSHGAKIQQFGKEYVKTRQFSREKARKLHKYLELWGKSRYSGAGFPLEEVPQLEELCVELVSFALETVSSESGRNQARLLAEIDANAETRYRSRIVGLKPQIAPGEIQFDAFEYIQHFRSEYISRKLVERHEIGLLGTVHVEIAGLHKASLLNQFENEVLEDVLARLAQCFRDLYELRGQVELRMKTDTHARDDSLRWYLMFNFLAHNLWYAIEDDVSIRGLARLFERWDEVIDKVLEISLSIGRRQRILDLVRLSSKETLRSSSAKESARNWFSKHVDLLEEAPIQGLALDQAFRDGKWTEMLDKDRDRLYALATTSPLVMDQYGGRIENELKGFWTMSNGSEFPPEQVRKILDLEESGHDIVKEQMDAGVRVSDICFGLEELVYRWRFRGISKEEEERLQHWDWFKLRVHDKRFKTLKVLIEKERQRQLKLHTTSTN